MGGWSTLAVLKMKLLRAPPLTLLFGRWRGGCNATTKEELSDPMRMQSAGIIL